MASWAPAAGPSEGWEVTLTRGLTADQGFAKWIKEFRFDKTRASRKSGSIVIYDFEGVPVTSYSIINAWPKKLTIGTPKAGDTSVLTETLVVEYESLDVEWKLTIVSEAPAEAVVPAVPPEAAQEGRYVRRCTPRRQPRSTRTPHPPMPTARGTRDPAVIAE